MKGLKQHIIDFEVIPTGNPKTLVVIDSSDYYTEPEKPLLEITLPGYNKYFLVNIEARKVNTFNSNTIGITTFLNGSEIVELPDGVYTYRFKVCPYDKLYKDKRFFRSTLIERELAAIYSKLDASDCSVSEDKKIISSIVEIHALIEGAKAVANKSEKKANQFYQLAVKLIDDVSNRLCKTCV